MMLIQDSLSVAIPCRASEPGLLATLESVREACLHPHLPTGVVSELLLCINGIRLGEECVPLNAVRDFCQRHEITIEEVWLDCQGEARDVPGSGSPVPRFPGSFSRCTVLLTERKGKPPAWNVLWRWVRGNAVLFADADVRIDRDAVYALYTRMRQEPTLHLVAAREVPFLPDGGTLWGRMGAIPYRFNFGNAGGRLLLLRKTALPNGIPDNLLLEDAWLTVAIGKTRVAKEWAARVFFVPPETWRDYFAERIRTEGGKLQIVREHGQLLAAGPVARYHWSHFWRELSINEYPLVLLSLLIKGAARLWARVTLTRKEFYSLYRPFSSTKEWGGQR
jgi:glycosyltransferase involved in cell wall biosynthesis